MAKIRLEWYNIDACCNCKCSSNTTKMSQSYCPTFLFVVQWTKSQNIRLSIIITNIDGTFFLGKILKIIVHSTTLYVWLSYIFCCGQQNAIIKIEAQAISVVLFQHSSYTYHWILAKSLSFIISICGKTILISLNSLNEHPIDENIVEYTLMLMDLIPTFRTAELIMNRNPLTSDHHAELVIGMSMWQCDWAEKRQRG